MKSTRMSEIFTFEQYLRLSAMSDLACRLAYSWYLPDGEYIDIVQSMN